MYWLEQTQGDVRDADDWLAPSEVASLQAMRFAKRRADWRLGRWTAKCAVAVRLGRPLTSHNLRCIELRAAECGAPDVFLDSWPAPLAISLSHRDGAAACLVAPSGVALGCDLETIEPRSDAFVADFFTAEEQSSVARAGAGRDLTTALIWSAKESALKALRDGLRRDTRSVVVSLGAAEIPAPPRQWRPLTVRYVGGGLAEGWWQHDAAVLRTAITAPPSAVPPALLQVPAVGSSAELKG